MLHTLQTKVIVLPCLAAKSGVTLQQHVGSRECDKAAS